ncbi:MAG: hypothetical protein IJ390_07630 [Lachnospiraceae bacterium]|nr:hypothetical protein [Lachnospiraceae bacterium]
MKFREEVFAKIFTYITVIVLMGIVIFEAWSIQREKDRLADANKDIAALEEEVGAVVLENQTLTEENDNLEAFQKQWSSYAAFVENKDVMALKTDLFSRPELIPDEVSKALVNIAEEKRTQSEEEESLPEKVELSFDNPDGEDTFLPLNTGLGEAKNCLIYTAAYWDAADLAVELLFEIDFTKHKTMVERDENGEAIWTCIAYNVGNGWIGFRVEDDLE